MIDIALLLGGLFLAAAFLRWVLTAPDEAETAEAHEDRKAW